MENCSTTLKPILTQLLFFTLMILMENLCVNLLCQVFQGMFFLLRSLILFVMILALRTYHLKLDALNLVKQIFLSLLPRLNDAILMLRECIKQRYHPMGIISYGLGMYEKQFYKTLGTHSDYCITNTAWYDPTSLLYKRLQKSFLPNVSSFTIRPQCSLYF